jgi:hypothetical protein
MFFNDFIKGGLPYIASQMLGIGMTKAYAIIKEYNAEFEAKGYFTMRGKYPRKYFE